MRYILVVLAVVCLAGCGTLAPAVYGKTTYDMKFGDKLSPGPDGTGGQDTTFSVFVKAPAGVKIEDLVSMGYEWQPDSGKIAVSKQASQDSTAQAEMIKAVSEMQMNAFIQGMTLAGGFATAALPVAGELMGQHMDLQAAQAQTNAANKFQLGQQLILSVDQVRAGVQQNLQDPAFREWLMDVLTQPGAGGATTPSP